VFACAADQRRLPLAAAVAVTVAVSGGWENDARQSQQSTALCAVPDMIGSMIGRMHHVVLDCPDPAALAAFYSSLLALPVTYRDDDWVVVAASDTSSGLAFQHASGHQPPTWPDPATPQQIHLDIMVEDVAAAARESWHWARQSSTAQTYTPIPQVTPFA
jgi:hypothetical protein